MRRLASLWLTLVLTLTIVAPVWNTASGADPLPVSPAQITGPAAVDSVKLVKLTAVNVPPKTGLLWHVRPQAGAGKPDYAQSGNRKLATLEFVAPPGQYDIELSLVTIGTDGTPNVDELLYTVTIGTPPAPVPVPPVPPVPPDPKPAGTGAFVIVVVDESNPTTAQGQVATGATLTALKTAGKCRVYGSVSDAATITAKKYDKMITDAKVSAPAVFVLDSTGKLVYAGKLPDTDAALSAALKGQLAP